MKLVIPRAPLFGRDTNGSPPTEVGWFVPAEDMFPGTETSEQALIEVLSALGRDDSLFYRARTNTIVSGLGDFDFKGRQQMALSTFCTSEEIRGQQG